MTQYDIVMIDAYLKGTVTQAFKEAMIVVFGKQEIYFQPLDRQHKDVQQSTYRKQLRLLL